MTSETLRTLSEPEKIESDSRSEPEMYPRGTLCLPHYARDTVISAGDDGYVEALQNYYQTHESNATERLVKLKAQLRNASTHEFWRIVMEELCAITGAQAGLVGKRVYVDETDHTIAMPDIGDPGSCVMAVTFYINAHGEKQLFRDYRYPAHGSPCAHMVHDKVLVIPERMHEFIRHNPNSMPWEKSEAFIGIPLFSGGQCFAHLALIWSCEGASQRKLGWTFIEMLLHSIEDIIVLRLEEGRTVGEGLLTQDGGEPLVPPPTEAPHHLKPHARGLSHELRTPMQGIVGMLDIMYTTVLNAIATTNSDMIRGVFEDLRRNIEVMQGTLYVVEIGRTLTVMQIVPVAQSKRPTMSYMLTS